MLDAVYLSDGYNSKALNLVQFFQFDGALLLLDRIARPQLLLSFLWSAHLLYFPVLVLNCTRGLL